MNSTSYTVADHQQIDRICDQFEQAWNQSDGRLSIEPWLKKAPRGLQARLFTELLALDAALRSQHDTSINSLSLSVMDELDSMDVSVGQWPALPGKLAETESGMSADATRRALLSCSTFRDLSPEASRALGKMLKVRQIEPSEVLLREGGAASGLYLILDGCLEVCKWSEGSSKCLAQVAQGSVLGEMSLLTDQVCTATVRAITQVSTLVLSADDYHTLRQRFPELEIALSQLVGDRLGARSLDSLCGRTIGHYRIQRCINRGGMGVVYGANHVTDEYGPPVALKMLRHNFVYDDHAVMHFLREGEILQRLRHPNILEVRDCFVAFNTRFMVMEFCDGEDLSKHIQRRGRLNSALVRALLGQLALGLQHSHAQGVLHLDLKPSNLLIHRDGRLTLADFGLSRMLGTDSSWSIVRGTPAYMPPEQLAGHPVDETGDWYAAGCLAVELLTGRKLFPERDLVQLCVTKQNSKPHENWPQFQADDQLRSIILDMLHVDPRERQFDYAKLAEWSRPVTEIFKPSRPR